MVIYNKGKRATWSLVLSNKLLQTMENNEKSRIALALYKLLTKVRNTQMRTGKHTPNKELEMLAVLFVIEEICNEKLIK